MVTCLTVLFPSLNIQMPLLRRTRYIVKINEVQMFQVRELLKGGKGGKKSKEIHSDTVQLF